MGEIDSGACLTDFVLSKVEYAEERSTKLQINN